MKPMLERALDGAALDADNRLARAAAEAAAEKVAQQALVAEAAGKVAVADKLS